MQQPLPSEKRTVLVTGANAGIGFAAARALLGDGHRVLLGCRDPVRGAAAVTTLRAEVPGADVDALTIDMSLQRSIRAAADRVEDVDVVIHNAASFDVRAKERTLTGEGHETIWATNYLGPALLTELLFPRLRLSADGRVIAVTSKGLAVHPWLEVDLDDVEFRDANRRRFSVPGAYYQSKLAHLAWMLDLAARLSASTVRAFGVRVTAVKIDLGRYPDLAWYLRAAYAVKSRFSISPQAMARTYRWLAVDDLGGDRGGTYWDGVGRAAPISRWAAVAEHRDALRALTQKQLGLD